MQIWSAGLSVLFVFFLSLPVFAAPVNLAGVMLYDLDSEVYAHFEQYGSNGRADTSSSWDDLVPLDFNDEVSTSVTENYLPQGAVPGEINAWASGSATSDSVSAGSGVSGAGLNHPAYGEAGSQVVAVSGAIDGGQVLDIMLSYDLEGISLVSFSLVDMSDGELIDDIAILYTGEIQGMYSGVHDAQGRSYSGSWDLEAGTSYVFVVSAYSNAHVESDYYYEPFSTGSSALLSITADASSAPAPVPEPSTMMLLGSGMVCLVYFRRMLSK